MVSEAEGSKGNAYVKLLHHVMVFLAVLVVARFVLEVAGVPQTYTRYVSSNAGLMFVAIYLAAVAPLRGGMKKFTQLFLPALLVSAWTVGWVILATIVSGVFRFERSHFAEQADYGDWRHLGRHVSGHLIEIGMVFAIVLILMAVVHVFWRWPVTVGPAAMLGALVIMRYTVEAMGAEAWRAAAWSSTVGVFLGAFYLGGVGPRLGLTQARQLLAPSLALGWGWRLWVFIATLMSALVPYYKTHFFDPTKGEVGMRLLRFLGFSVLEGFVAGLVVWGIAVWISRATRQSPA